MLQMIKKCLIAWGNRFAFHRDRYLCVLQSDYSLWR